MSVRDQNRTADELRVQSSAKEIKIFVSKSFAILFGLSSFFIRMSCDTVVVRPADVFLTLVAVCLRFSMYVYVRTYVYVYETLKQPVTITM